MGQTESGCGGRHSSVDSVGGEGELEGELGHEARKATDDGHDDGHIEDPFFDEELEYSPRLTRFESILDSRGYLNPSFFPPDWLDPVAEGDGDDGGGDGRDDYDDEGYDDFEALNGGGGGGDGDGVGSLDAEPPSGRRGRAESTRVLHKSIATLHAAEDAADSGAPPGSASSPASSSSSSSSSAAASLSSAIPVPLSSAALPGPGKLRPSEMKTVLRTKLTTTLATFWALFVGDDAADGVIRDHHESSGNSEIDVSVWEAKGVEEGAGCGAGSGGAVRAERVQNFRSPIKGALPGMNKSTRVVKEEVCSRYGPRQGDKGGAGGEVMTLDANCSLLDAPYSAHFKVVERLVLQVNPGVGGEASSLDVHVLVQVVFTDKAGWLTPKSLICSNAYKDISAGYQKWVKRVNSALTLAGQIRASPTKA